MARRRSSSGRRSDLRWTLGTFTSAALSAGSAQAVILSTSVQSVTLMRTRGELLVYMDSTQTPGNLLLVACGMLVQQAGAVATSLPITDGQAPFFWYEAFHVGYEEYVTDVIDCPLISAYRVPIDSKAMRIIRPDQEVVFIVEQATAIGAGEAINVGATARFLLGS